MSLIATHDGNLDSSRNVSGLGSRDDVDRSINGELKWPKEMETLQVSLGPCLESSKEGIIGGILVNCQS